MEPSEVEVVQPTPPQEPIASATVAPAWHTIVLVAGIAALSIQTAWRFSAPHSPVNRFHTYGSAAILDLILLVWVAFGLRLKKIPLRSLLGDSSFDPRTILLDSGLAFVFWIGSLMVLSSISLAWSGAAAVFTHHPATHTAEKSGPFPTPDPERLKELHRLAELAPEDGTEIAAWVLLCMIVGFSEELVFRGYLQRQCIGLARGRVAWGILASAVVFGSAHAYQGVRGMVLIAVFGALFGVMAHFRRGLRAGMIAHCWHDLISGLTLAFLRSNHII